MSISYHTLIVKITNRHDRADWWYLLVAIVFPVFAWMVYTYVAMPLANLSTPTSSDPIKAEREERVLRIGKIIVVALLTVVGIVVGMLLSINS